MDNGRDIHVSLIGLLPDLVLFGATLSISTEDGEGVQRAIELAFFVI
jgi:hypothetical protein